MTLTQTTIDRTQTTRALEVRQAIACACGGPVANPSRLCTTCAADARTLLMHEERCWGCGDLLPALAAPGLCAACEEDTAIDKRDSLNRERETVGEQRARWLREAQEVDPVFGIQIPF